MYLLPIEKRDQTIWSLWQWKNMKKDLILKASSLYRVLKINSKLFNILGIKSGLINKKVKLQMYLGVLNIWNPFFKNIWLTLKAWCWLSLMLIHGLLHCILMYWRKKSMNNMKRDIEESISRYKFSQEIIWKSQLLQESMISYILLLICQICGPVMT